MLIIHFKQVSFIIILFTNTNPSIRKKWQKQKYIKNFKLFSDSQITHYSLNLFDYHILSNPDLVGSLIYLNSNLRKISLEFCYQSFSMTVKNNFIIFFLKLVLKHLTIIHQLFQLLKLNV
jgi:hypothetical protein